jgi:hypothetical protein
MFTLLRRPFEVDPDGRDNQISVPLKSKAMAYSV